MGEWRTATLGELCATGGLIQTGPFGSQLHASDYIESGGVPVIMPKDLKDSRINLSTIARISEEEAIRLTRHRVQSGDIVYSRRGDVERHGRVGPDEEGFLCGTGCLLVRPGPAVDSHFLSYQLSKSEVKAWLSRHAVGATMPNLNTKILSELPIEVPDMSTQRSIAAVLGALDNKIASNRATLHAYDALVRSEYQLITSSATSVVPLGDLAVEIKEQASVDMLGADDRYVGLDLVPRRDIWLEEWDVAEVATSHKNRFYAGDVLFGRLRPYFHKVVHAPFHGVCSTDMLVLRSKKSEYSGYVLAAISSDDIVAHATALSDGTRMPRVKWKDLSEFEVPWPGPETVLNLSHRIFSVSTLCQSLIKECRMLSSLRDTLLLGLMDRTIALHESENLVSNAF